jgi:hypothetical protein
VPLEQYCVEVLSAAVQVLPPPDEEEPSLLEEGLLLEDGLLPVSTDDDTGCFMTSLLLKPPPPTELLLCVTLLLEEELLLEDGLLPVFVDDDDTGCCMVSLLSLLLLQAVSAIVRIRNKYNRHLVKKWFMGFLFVLVIGQNFMYLQNVDIAFLFCELFKFWIF